MPHLHFIRLDDAGHSIDELNEIAEMLEEALRSRGRHNDLVMVLERASWQGSIEFDLDDD